MKRLLILLVPLALVATGCAAGAPSAQPVDQEPSSASSASAAPSAGPRATPAPEPVRPETFDLWKFQAPVVPLELSGSELVPPADPTVVGWWGKRAGAKTGTTLLTG